MRDGIKRRGEEWEGEDEGIDCRERSGFGLGGKSQEYYMRFMELFHEIC